MINHEGTVGIRAGKHLADEAVCMLYLPDEYVVTFHVDAFIGFVYGAECIQNVSGNDLGVDGGIPDVGFHTTGVRMAFVYMPVFMMMCMGIVQNEFHILGHIEELQVGSIVRQFFRPCLLETDVADAEIGFALGKVDKLLGRGVVGFRTCTFGNHADYCEPVAGNGFGEVSQRLERNGNDGFAAGFVALAAFGLAGSYEYGCEQ